MGELDVGAEELEVVWVLYPGGNSTVTDFQAQESFFYFLTEVEPGGFIFDLVNPELYSGKLRLLRAELSPLDPRDLFYPVFAVVSSIELLKVIHEHKLCVTHIIFGLLQLFFESVRLIIVNQTFFFGVEGSPHTWDARTEVNLDFPVFLSPAVVNGEVDVFAKLVFLIEAE